MKPVGDDTTARGPGSTDAARALFWGVVVVAVAVAVRVAYFAAFRSSPLFDVFFADHLYYREWALTIASGETWGPGSFEQGPLYAYLLALLFRLLGHATAPVVLFQLSAGVATAALVFSCARRIAGNRAAAVAGLLAAVYGPFVFHEGLLMKSFLEPLLVSAALYCCLRYAEQRRPAWIAAACAAIGLACLVREVQFLLLPVILLWSLRKEGAPDPWRRRLLPAAAGAAAFLAVLAPASLHNWAADKEFVAVTSGGGEVFFMAFGPYAGPYYTPPPYIQAMPGSEHEYFRDEARLRAGRYLSRAEASRWWYSEGFASILSDPGRALQLMGQRALIVANDFEAPDTEDFAVSREAIPFLRFLPTFGWLVGLGVLGAVAPAPGRRRFLLFGFLLAGVLGILLSYPFGRFRLALIPVWLVMAGIGADWIAGAWRGADSAGRRGVAAAGVAVAALITGLSFLPPPASGAWVRATDDGFRGKLREKTAMRDLIPRSAEAFANSPSDPRAADALANQLEVIGKWHEASALYRRALELDPGMEPARWSLMSIHFHQGDYPAALGEARLYTAAFPSSAGGRIAAGVFATKVAMQHAGEERQRLLQEARDQFGQALRQNPRDADAHYYRARMIALAGDTAGAIEGASAALAIQPDFPQAFHMRRILTDRGNKGRY
jgi:4-amino-4-deoxy-L-arabinose transferase-like glycosyltransferase